MRFIIFVNKYARLAYDYAAIRSALASHFSNEMLLEIYNDPERRVVLIGWLALYMSREVTLIDAVLGADMEMAEMSID